MILNITGKEYRFEDIYEGIKMVGMVSIFHETYHYRCEFFKDDTLIGTWEMEVGEDESYDIYYDVDICKEMASNFITTSKEILGNL